MSTYKHKNKDGSYSYSCSPYKYHSDAGTIEEEAAKNALPLPSNTALVILTFVGSIPYVIFKCIENPEIFWTRIWPILIWICVLAVIVWFDVNYVTGPEYEARRKEQDERLKIQFEEGWRKNDALNAEHARINAIIESHHYPIETKYKPCGSSESVNNAGQSAPSKKLPPISRRHTV